jgi:N-acetylmuramoyl-L-alanine amidase
LTNRVALLSLAGVMKLTLFGRKGLDVRTEMLRDVFEQNRTLSKGRRPGVSFRRRFPLRRIVILLFVTFLAVLFHTSDVNTPFRSSITYSLPIQYRMAFPEGSFQTPDMSPLQVLETTGNLPLSRMLGLKIKTIMIDPGHGGDELGCVGGRGTREKDITLDLARRVKAHLAHDSRCRVHLTREDDRTVPLETRVRLAREAKADVFVSIHVNSIPSNDINIVETYYFGPSKDAKTLQLAGRENAGSEYGLSDFKKLMEKLGAAMKLQESRELAKSIQTYVLQTGRAENNAVLDHGVKRAPFVVLLGPEVPAVLSEVSCLSNVDEEARLNSEDHKERIARSLAAGILNYLNKGGLTYEAKQRAETK